MKSRSLSALSLSLITFKHDPIASKLKPILILKKSVGGDYEVERGIKSLWRRLTVECVSFRKKKNGTFVIQEIGPSPILRNDFIHNCFSLFYVVFDGIPFHPQFNLMRVNEKKR